MLVNFLPVIEHYSMVRVPFRIRFDRRKAYGVGFVSGFTDPVQVGSCDPNKHEIKILKDMSNRQTADTLLHESIHLLNFEFNLGLTESQVEGIEQGMSKIFNLNPEFVRMLYEVYRKNAPRSK